ncbi:MAG TPA: aminoglycoside adenylyltransferase domain-containing protein [Bacillota bacterium]|nr:aminoglycoside adenylyltransferase domain-containing protein [Bacillota bacterium]
MIKYQELFQRTFPGRLFGLYLVGSTALGAYREGKSDLDFIVVLNQELQPSEILQLVGIHRSIAKAFPGVLLEGSYLTPAQLGKTGLTVPDYHDGRIKFKDINVITWFILKNYGIPLLGPAPRDLPFTVKTGQLHQYISQNLDSYWGKWLRGIRTPWTLTRFTGLFPQKIEWGVLGIARLYYTLRENDIVSKEQAGEYVLPLIPASFHRIGAEALRIRKNERQTSWYSPWRRRQDAILFIEYMIKQCKNFFLKNHPLRISDR